MPTQDIGIRWSEEKYATKDEVRDAYNMSMIDNIWKQIIDYRRLYTKTLDLHNIDRTPYMVVVTQTIQLKVASVERRLSRILVKTHDMKAYGKELFAKRRYAKTIEVLDSNYKTNISQEMVSHLLDEDLSTIPSQYSLIYNYIRTLKYYASGHYTDIIDYRLLESILKQIQGVSFDNLTLEKEYREEEIETSHYYQNNYVYKAAPIERIADMIDELCNFVRESDLSPVIKAIVANYYLNYVKPFDYLNEEANALFAKICLGHFDFDEASMYLNFEKIVFDTDEKLNKISVECQKTLDLTYYVNYILDLLDEDLKDILDEIVLTERDEIKNEQIDLSEDEGLNAKSTVEEEAKPSERSVAVMARPVEFVKPQETSPYIGKSNVALPVFPAGLKEQDVEGIVTNLLEVYPYLKRTQAHFYARHCTIGKHYTISQFKKEENVAYETARTSMDFLAENGFYSKTKVRNKFVYSPVPRN